MPQPVQREGPFFEDFDLGQLILDDGDEVHLTLNTLNATREVVIKDLEPGYHTIDKQVGEVTFVIHLEVTGSAAMG